jgi:hypothetical protein
MLTSIQAKTAKETCVDVSAPDEDGDRQVGCIDFLSSRNGVQGAVVVGRLVNQWYPLTDIELCGLSSVSVVNSYLKPVDQYIR